MFTPELRRRPDDPDEDAYWLLGVVVGDGFAGAGVELKASIRIFKSSPSRITDQ
jgi:hypothetical protein